MTERESMDYDVVIVGAGPSGLSAAIRLKQLSANAGQDLSVCVVEKGSEIGAHILSGAIIEPRALSELIPDWQERGAPLGEAVKEDQIYLFQSQTKARRIPNWLAPKTMHNAGNYIASLGNLCRWLGEQAEALEVELYPGFAASEVLYHPDGRVKGIATGDMGRDSEGQPKASFEPGMELHARYTLFSEGSRGQLGKELIARFELAKDATPQHYGIGLKELWEIEPDKHQPGLVIHGAGWPLGKAASGGSFLYHGENNQVMVGLIVDLSYANPHLSPFEEFQRLKHHPRFANTLQGGKRICYGARAITKGGLNSLPKQSFPGGLLLGCDAGTLNFAKIKGSHTAIKSGMLGAEAVFEAIGQDTPSPDYQRHFQSSWLYSELKSSRNFGPALHKWGTTFGGAFNMIEQNWFGGKMPFTLQDTSEDHTQLKPASDSPVIDYPKPDNQLSFDRLSSVFISNTNHEEDQPVHLKLTDPTLPISRNLPLYDAPEQRYCPAGVYEILEEESGKPRLQINAQNCLHCKSCDIKDPNQNITWVAPEGGGGPNYPNM